MRKECLTCKFYSKGDIVKVQEVTKCGDCKFFKKESCRHLKGTKEVLSSIDMPVWCPLEDKSK